MSRHPIHRLDEFRPGVRRYSATTAMWAHLVMCSIITCVVAPQVSEVPVGLSEALSKNVHESWQTVNSPVRPSACEARHVPPQHPRPKKSKLTNEVNASASNT